MRLLRRSCGTVETLESRRLLSAGDVVTSYGAGGVATLPYVGRTEDSTTAFAQLADGRVLVGGNSFATTTNDVGTLMRFNADGTPDTSLGNGTGELRLDAITWEHGVNSLGVFPDGSFLGTGNPLSGSPASVRHVQKFLADGSPDPSWVGPGTTPGTSPRATKPLDATRSIYLTSSSVSRLQANGTLDTTFGTGGLTTFPTVNFTRFVPFNLAIQTDGMIVLVGEMLTTGTAQRVPAVQRYTATGQLDTTFGTGGTTQLASANPSSASSSLRDVIAMPDGKIYVAGSNGNAPIVARLNAGGTPDTTFVSGTGTRTLNTINGSAFRMLLASGGRVLLTGYRNTGDALTSGPYLAKVTIGGVMDPTYGGGDGIVEQLMPHGWVVLTETHVLPLPGGQLLAANASFESLDTGASQLLMRVNADGSIDQTFAPDPSPQLAGIRRHNFTSALTINAGIAAVQPDGKPVLVGTGLFFGMDGPVARLTTSGTPDPSFGGGDGMIGFDAGARFDEIRNAAVQDDGKIVLAGRAMFAATGELDERFLVARINPDGSRDSSFGTNGVAISEPGGFVMQYNVVRIAADGSGRILAAGLLNNGAAVVARYTANGQPDATFGPGGRRDVEVGPGGGGETIIDLIPLPDGRTLIAGTVGLATSGETNRYVARLDASGNLDATFGGSDTGYVALDAAVGAVDNEAALGIDRDADGNIYLGGTMTSPSRNVTVTRFDSEGNLDTSYGAGGTASMAVGSGDSLAAVARDPNGKFVFAGDRQTGSDRDFLALRLTAAGQLDSTFGAAGVRTINGGSTSEFLTGIDFLDGGAGILLTGRRTLPAGGPIVWSAVQLEGDPVLFPPAVTGVFVGGTTWTQPFRDHLAASGQGDATFGFAIDPAAAPDELPWVNLNKVSVRFGRDVNVVQENLSITGVRTPTYATSAFAYDAATFTATWTLAGPAIANDKIALNLTGVTDAATGTPLDAPARVRLNVLPGDANRSGGSVIGSDVTLVRNAQNSPPGGVGSLYTIFKDVNGSATIVGSDVTAVRNRQGLRLPAEPEPSFFSPTTLAPPAITFKRLSLDPLRATSLANDEDEAHNK